MATNLFIQAIYILEFSIGRDHTSFVCPLWSGDLSVSRLRITEHAADLVEKLEKDR
jgi:hypothetical protein